MQSEGIPTEAKLKSVLYEKPPRVCHYNLAPSISLCTHLQIHEYI